MLLAATSSTPDRQAATAPTYSGFERQHATRNRKLHRRLLLLAKEMELRLPAPDRHTFRCRSDAAAAVAAAAAAAQAEKCSGLQTPELREQQENRGPLQPICKNKMENSPNAALLH